MVMITTDDLRALMSVELGPAVSLFMPTHVAGREIRQDPIRLRKLIEDAARQLTAAGQRRPEAEALLAPAARLAGRTAISGATRSAALRSSSRPSSPATSACRRN